MKIVLLILCLKAIVPTSFSQEVGTRLFSKHNFIDLIGKPLSSLPDGLAINTTIVDSVRMNFFVYKIYGEILLDTQYFFSGKFEIKSCYLCVNKQNNISALIFQFKTDASSIRDSLLNLLGMPSVRFSNNINENFGLAKNKGDWYWKFQSYAINIYQNYYNAEILVVNNLKPDNYLREIKN